MRFRLCAVLSAGLVLASVAAASADVVDIVADKDANIRMGSATYNTGQDSYMVVGDNTFSQTFRGFIHFDLSSLPAGATVTEALLLLSPSVSPSVSSYEISAYRLLKGWAEGNGNSAGSATSGVTASYPDKANTAVAWSAGGADATAGASPDRLATATATVDAKDAANQIKVSGRTYVQWDVTSDVQAFYAQPAGNYGWVLVGAAGANYKFTSTQNATVKPYLRVTYTVPEPATAGLMTLGVLVMGVRRR